MKTIGIICEYNPFHLGHLKHIEKTKAAVGSDAYIVCVMSGNFVQRGDMSIFNKHARAKMAVLGGADIVLDLPLPYALSSAREFARAGVHILDSLGVCDVISFGSEAGKIDILQRAAEEIVSDRAQEFIREALKTGVSYATAQQRAADAVLGEISDVFRHPNNTLGIEYIKALNQTGAAERLRAMTIRRTGGAHDGNTGYSASSLRRALSRGDVPLKRMHGAAVAVCLEEMLCQRGPVLMKNMEQAILSRLRLIRDYSRFPGATDGLDRRFLHVAGSAASLSDILLEVKSKRYAMSRIRRVLMCAVLGITNEYIAEPPPYIRVLAMNSRGMEVLKAAGKYARLPLLTKPASVRELDQRCIDLFELESSATDFYTLSYANADDRAGGSEWRTSPLVL